MKPVQGSLHVALKSVVVRPELGDLNVIIQVEEWHSSDRFGGTVRADIRTVDASMSRLALVPIHRLCDRVAGGRHRIPVLTRS